MPSIASKKSADDEVNLMWCSCCKKSVHYFWPSRLRGKAIQDENGHLFCSRCHTAYVIGYNRGNQAVRTDLNRVLRSPVVERLSTAQALVDYIRNTV